MESMYVITHDFDLSAQKKPKKSTLDKQLKIADKILNAKEGQSVVNEFDRIKFGVNLDKYAEYIDFEIIGLFETEYPYLNPYDRDKKRLNDLITRLAEGNSTIEDSDNNNDNETGVFYGKNNIQEYEEDDEYDYNIDDIQEELEENWADDFQEALIEEHNKRVLEQDEKYDYKKKNYGIDYDTCKNTIGLNDIVVKTRYLIIDITGKFMATTGYLGKIDRNNIRDCLQRILNLNLIKFDIDKLLEVAQIFSTDVCVDIDYDTSKKVKSVITGASSFFPIASDSYRIFKYGRSGLFLTKKAKRNGEALTFYHKGEELTYRNSTSYQRIIGKSGIELADKTLRIEYKLYKLENIRKAFNIEAKEHAIVRLSDVLNSTQKPILKALEIIEVEPNRLREKIYGWIENEPNIDNGISEKSLSSILLAERFVELLIENNYDIQTTKNHIKTEYSGMVNEKTIKNFITLSNNMDYILNFLIYRKPKSVTIVLELLKKVYEYYGMEL